MTDWEMPLDYSSIGIEVTVNALAGSLIRTAVKLVNRATRLLKCFGVTVVKCDVLNNSLFN